MPAKRSVVTTVFKRARRGLYAGKNRLSGHTISEDGGNRTKRAWKPNVHAKAVFSDALDRMVRLRLTTAAIRCIDRAGGLDQYLLRTPDRKLNSDVGEALRGRVRAALARTAAQQAQQASRGFAASGVRDAGEGMSVPGISSAPAADAAEAAAGAEAGGQDGEGPAAASSGRGGSGSWRGDRKEPQEQRSQAEAAPWKPRRFRYYEWVETKLPPQKRPRRQVRQRPEWQLRHNRYPPVAALLARLQRQAAAAGQAQPATAAAAAS